MGYLGMPESHLSTKEMLAFGKYSQVFYGRLFVPTLFQQGFKAALSMWLSPALSAWEKQRFRKRGADQIISKGSDSKGSEVWEGSKILPLFYGSGR